MEKNIIKNYGWCNLFTMSGKFFISFDDGASVVHMTEHEITEEDMQAAIESELMAEKISREVQTRNQKK